MEIVVPAADLSRVAGCTDLVISPHFDDAALSCGGAVAAWLSQGRRPAVVTVCAGYPGPHLTTFARQQHERWGETTDLVGLRRAEDQAALAALGVPGVWLSLPDCIYRGAHYTSDAALFGSIAMAEAALPARVAEALRALLAATDGARLVAPLGIGNHVDHQIVHQAARLLQRDGTVVLWYEDQPYVSRPGGEAQRQHLSRGRTPDVVDIRATLETKLRAVAAYASQVPVLFGDTAGMATALAAHARQAGGGEFSERFWRDQA